MAVLCSGSSVYKPAWPLLKKIEESLPSPNCPSSSRPWVSDEVTHVGIISEVFLVANPVTGVFPGSYIPVDFSDAGAGVADTHQIAPFGAILMTGYTLSCMIKWKLSRVGGSDTYNADAKLLELDIHYEIDRPGSRQEYIK